MTDKHLSSRVGPGSTRLEGEEDEDEFLPMSNKPFIEMIMAKTHVDPATLLYIPRDFKCHMPPGRWRNPATVLTYRGSSWIVTYYSNGDRHGISTGWKRFVVDNGLKEGDTCIFELLECSPSASEIKFRVQILRDMSIFAGNLQMKDKGASSSRVGSGSTRLEEEEDEDEDEDEFFPMSGKPYCDMILANTHVDPALQLYLPQDFKCHFPPGPWKNPTTVLTYRRRSWIVTCYSTGNRHAFTRGWKRFVVDNGLKKGDACIFELLECSPSASEIKFRVQILRGDFPTQLLASVVDGETREDPITIGKNHSYEFPQDPNRS